MFSFFLSVLNFENLLIFQAEQFRIFDHFWNQSIIAIWKMANFLFNLENYQNSEN